LRPEKIAYTKGVIRNCKSKDKQYSDQNEKGEKDKQWSIKHYTENERLRQEKFEDTKEVVRSCKSKDRQYID
jgi:hypothetical protein